MKPDLPPIPDKVWSIVDKVWPGAALDTQIRERLSAIMEEVWPIAIQAGRNYAANQLRKDRTIPTTIRQSAASVAEGPDGSHKLHLRK